MPFFFGLYQQVFIPALLPPFISLERESPIIMTSNLLVTFTLSKTWLKNSILGFSAYNIWNEGAINNFIKVWFFHTNCLNIFAPFETIYCLYLPLSDDTSSKLFSTYSIVLPSAFVYSSLKSFAIFFCLYHTL